MPGLGEGLLHDIPCKATLRRGRFCFKRPGLPLFVRWLAAAREELPALLLSRAGYASRGCTFLLTRNRFAGSHSALISASRS